MAAEAIHAALQRTADSISSRHDCSVSIALHAPDLGASSDITAAAGFVDFGLGEGPKLLKADPADDYVWGSTTKMFTAAAVLQLVERGLVSLDSPILTRVLNGSELAVRFSWLSGVTVREVLHMTSGLADYDGSAYEKSQFAQPQHDFTPMESLSATFTAAAPAFPPATRQAYSSSNYVLLGLLLAAHAGVPTWADLDQSAVFRGGLTGR